MESNKLNATDALSFMLAGKATVTIKKPSTGGRFTYKIGIPADQTPETATIYFVSILNGADNTSDFGYVGFIRKHELTFVHGGNKARAGKDAASVVVFNTIFNFIVANHKLPHDIEIWHEGKCGRCGRKLTVPESIANGIGPECARIQGKFLQSLMQPTLL